MIGTSVIRCLSLLLLVSCAVAQQPQMPAKNAVRIAEFYRLAPQIQDQIWPAWSKVPAPLMLVTPDGEFLTHHPAPPQGFTKLGDDLYARPRQFPLSLQATFPAFGPPAVIVVGEAENTLAKTSTPWLIMLMHEHFHQLQSSQPGYYAGVEKLGLTGGDTTGMWMLNYPFPYEKPEVAAGFSQLRDLLLQTLAENDRNKLQKLAKTYVKERNHWFEHLSANDHKYFGFELWQEGMARYTEIKAAEAAANYQPSATYKALPDYQPFPAYAARARSETLAELKRAELVKWQRTVVYSFGAAEGLLLDRINPGWKKEYFAHPFSTDGLFRSP